MSIKIYTPGVEPIAVKPVIERRSSAFTPGRQVWNWRGWDSSFCGAEGKPKSFEEFQAWWSAHVSVWYKAVLNKSGAIPGGERTVGLVYFRPWSKSVDEVHAIFHRSVWGTDIVNDTFRHALKDRFASGVRKIQGTVRADNSAAASLAERAGFQLEGVLRHSVHIGAKSYHVRIYGLLPEEMEVHHG